MNAVDLLKQDHRTVESLFKEAENVTPAKQGPIFKKIKGELDTHAHIEEKIFYPKLKKEGNKELVDIVLEGFEEHSQIKKFLREIAAITPNNEAFEAKLKVLMEDTRHHVKEEENEMFPLVEDQFTSEALEKLGARMEAEKKKYQTANRITPVKPKKGVVETMMDTAKTLVGGLLPAFPEPKKATGSKSKAASTKNANGRGAGSTARKAGNGKGEAQTTKAKSATAARRSTTKASGAKATSKPAAQSGKGGTRRSAASAK